MEKAIEEKIKNFELFELVRITEVCLGNLQIEATTKDSDTSNNVFGFFGNKRPDIRIKYTQYTKEVTDFLNEINEEYTKSTKRPARKREVDSSDGGYQGYRY